VPYPTRYHSAVEDSGSYNQPFQRDYFIPSEVEEWSALGRRDIGGGPKAE